MSLEEICNKLHDADIKASAAEDGQVIHAIFICGDCSGRVIVQDVYGKNKIFAVFHDLASLEDIINKL